LDIHKIVDLPQTGMIYDRNGRFVAKIQSAQDRVSVPLSSVPRDVQNAFLAAEDLRFYQHPGIDPVRIFGAIRSNLRSGDYAEGASTITQQLIKLSHLSAQKTIARKLEEMYLALQLESRYSKDEILEMYLNFIYFGRGAYGIQAAAQAYFGVDAAQLTAAQGAALSAVIKAPSAYAPHLHPEQNRQRQEYIRPGRGRDPRPPGGKNVSLRLVCGRRAGRSGKPAFHAGGNAAGRRIPRVHRAGYRAAGHHRRPL
jgi:membrane peptidoglycan carboxypeptidase